MQVRLTPAGEQLAERREQAASQAAADLHWGRMLTYQCCECRGAFEVDWGEGQVRYDAQ